MITMPYMAEKDRARFWSYVSIKGPDECWLWQSPVNHNGYGHFSVVSDFSKINLRSNRVAYFISTGDDPEENLVCHICDTPACCNPAHLFLGTSQDNHDDCKSKGRKAKGASNNNSKITEQDVREIRRYGITQANVSEIVNNRTWRHVK